MGPFILYADPIKGSRAAFDWLRECEPAIKGGDCTEKKIAFSTEFSVERSPICDRSKEMKISFVDW